MWLLLWPVVGLEIKRQCQLSYKSALFLMHRIRFAMKDFPANTTKLFGEVEIDETFCGGKPRLQTDGTRVIGTGYRRDTNKTPVVAIIKRKGDVRAAVIPCVNGKNLSQFINKNVVKGSVVNTNQFPLYKSVIYPLTRFGDGKHVVVNHGRREYARHNLDGTIAHVNTCESFFSLLKRGLIGTFHSVSKEHLHRYCDEFSFRWNTRKLNDGQRTVLAIEGAAGKRLAYYGV